MVKQTEIIEQFEIFDVPSPCIGVCQSNNRGYCLGCFRSRDERFNWNTLSLAEKKAIVKLCLQRKKRVLARKEKQIIGIRVDSDDDPQSELDF